MMRSMSSQFRLISGAASCVGNIRMNNEDNFYLCGSSPTAKELESDSSVIIKRSGVGARGVFCVCDGVGGEEHGELASLITVSTLDEICSGTELTAKGAAAHIASELIEKSGARVAEKSRELGVSFIGTTLALMIITGSKAFAVNVGDSRIYHLRAGRLTQISHDHTRRQYYIDLGLLRQDEPAGPLGHELTSCIGMEHPGGAAARHFASPIELEKGDMFILCSDGLTDMVSEKEISSIALGTRNHSDISQALVKAALRAGGADNVTVLTVCVA